jgi:protein farnesyltransferase subunit beta
MAHQPLLVEANKRKFDSSKGLPAIKPTTPEGGWKSEEERQAVRREVWANALGWDQVGEDHVLGGQVNYVVSAPLPPFKVHAKDRTLRRRFSTFCLTVSRVS